MKMLGMFEKLFVRTDEFDESIDAIAFELKISHRSVQRTFHDDLNMHRICLHMVPKILSLEQKEVGMIMSWDLIDMANKGDSFLKKILRSDMPWRFLYESQIKRQLSEWKEKYLQGRKTFA